MDHGPPRPVVLSLRGCRSPGVARHTGMPRRKDHGPPRRVVLWAFEFHCTARDPLRCRQCAIFFYKKILHLQSQLLLCLLSKKKLQSILLEWHFKSCLKARLHRFKITVYFAFAKHSATEVNTDYSFGVRLREQELDSTSVRAGSAPKRVGPLGPHLEASIFN